MRAPIFSTFTPARASRLRRFLGASLAFAPARASRLRRFLGASLFFFLALTTTPAIAGPWTPGRLHFYGQVRQSVLLADRRYDAAGDLRPILLAVDAAGATAETSYRQTLTDVYFELGLASRLSVLADFRAFTYVAQPAAGHPTRSALGISDLWLATKLLLFDDELTASLLVGASVPLGDAAAAVPLGQGDVSGDIQVLVGKLLPRRVYVAAEAGVRLRSHARVTDPRTPGATIEQQYSHELRFAAVAGTSFPLARRFADAIGVAAKLEGAYALTAPVEDSYGVLTPAAGTYLKLGAEFIWTPVRGVAITLGGHGFALGRALPAFGEIALAIGWSR